MQDFIITQKNNLWWGSFPRLTQAGFGNACSCRLHGASAVTEGTLNLALHVGDEAELVLQNRCRFAQVLGLDASKFTTCEQVHGSKVVVIDEALVGAGATTLADTIKETDALVTNLANVPLLLFFADCVPLLFVDERQGVCAVAHAGWRGTVAQIGRKTVETMQQAFGSRPEDIVAAIGPSIGQCCYEVDDFVRSKAAGYEQFFAPRAEKPGKYLLDLWGYNREVLLNAGLKAENILTAGVCTEHNHEMFCSYRAEQGKTGRMGVCLYRMSDNKNA